MATSSHSFFDAQGLRTAAAAPRRPRCRGLRQASCRRRARARPEFLAKQLPTSTGHGRLDRRPAPDDRPARRGAREQVVAGALFPTLIEPGPPGPVRRRGDPQDAVACAGRHHLLESVLDALSAAQHRVYLLSRPVADGAARSAPPGRVVYSATCPPPRSWNRVRGVRRLCAQEHDGRLSNIVFMGAWGSRWRITTGYRQPSSASSRRPPEGFGISARSVTVSTVGLAPGHPQAGGREAWV